MKEEREKMLELLADEILFGLTEQESAELGQLKKNFPELKDDDSFEAAAAIINLMRLEINESLPAHLETKIELQGKAFFGDTEKLQPDSELEKKKFSNAAAGETAETVYKTSPKPSGFQWLGWALAAAASIALAANLWLTRFQRQPEVAKNPETIQTPEVTKTPEAIMTPRPELSAAQQLERLLASAPDVVQTNWTSPKDKKEILGDIVWSNEEQKGFMRFRGLPVNNPNEKTYQLWIVDESRNAKTPLSGGVFDVNQTGEVVIPINAQLQVKTPKAFKITVEKPGGVVVSAPTKVVAIANI